MGRDEPPIELQDREHNSTKFIQCGWCQYATGSHRYNYCISGQCKLQKRYGTEITWMTPCFFITASKADIQAIIDSKVFQIKEYQQSINRQMEYCAILGTIQINTIPDRPCLPNDRKHNHFNVGETVMVWFADKQQWFPGEVRMGYRHHDGCVSYCLEGVGPQAANDEEFPYKGGYWGQGCAVPTVMLRSEWDWFKDNPVEYVRWCDSAYAKSFNGKTLIPAFI